MELDKDKVQRVAQMLESASSLLRDAATPSSSNSEPRKADPTRSSTNVSDSLQSALDHARGMIRNSTSSGTCRRLNRAERLRAAAPINLQGRKKQPAKSKKAFECALLKCFGGYDEDLNEQHNMKWDSIITQGIILLGEGDNEKAVRQAIKELLVKKIPIIGDNDFDFEFVKVKQKKITCLDLGAGAEYNFSVVKKLCGQGLLYVKIKEGYEFLYEEGSSSDNGNDGNVHDDDKPLTSTTINLDDDDDKDDDKLLTSALDYHDDKHLQTSTEIDNEKTSPSKAIYDEIVDIITTKSLSDPVEVLRLLQQKLIKGRKLDVTTADLIEDPSLADKPTNYICVNRENILKTTFDELESVEDYCITFEVNFMGEVAKDYGGVLWSILMQASGSFLLKNIIMLGS